MSVRTSVLIAAVTVTATVVASMGIASSTPPGHHATQAEAETLSSSGCGDKRVCIWDEQAYRGAKRRFLANACCEWKSVRGYSSAKNRFFKRKVLLRPSSIANPTCLRPGKNLCCVLDWQWIRVTGRNFACP